MNKKLKNLITLTFFSITTIHISAQSETISTKFFAVGDTGTGGITQYDVSKAIEKKCKESGCEFGLLLGDNVYNNGVKDVNDSQFKSKFEDPYKNLDLPIYLTLGNHDYRGNVQAEIDYSKKSKKWVLPARTYKFSKGNIDFFSIDTNNPSKEQEEKLEKDINNSKAKWKIVFGHHPRYTNGVYQDATGALKELLDKPLCNKADLYLCGHEHNKQHLKKTCGVEYLIVGTGAGTRSKLSKEKNTLFGQTTLGFSWFEATDKELHFQILNTSGKVEYEYRIKK